jgi:hypothetical protein
MVMVSKLPPRNTKAIIEILKKHGYAPPALIDDLYTREENIWFWRYQDGYDAGYARALEGLPHEYPQDNQ